MDKNEANRDVTVRRFFDSTNYYRTKKESIVDAEKAYYMIETQRPFPGRSHTVSTLTRRSVEVIYPRIRARYLTGGKVGVSVETHGANANTHLEEMISSYLDNKVNVDMDIYNEIRDFIKQGVRSGTTLCQVYWNKKDQRACLDTIDVFDIFPEPRCKDIKDVKAGKNWMIIVELTTLSDIKKKIDSGIYEDIISDLIDVAGSDSQSNNGTNRKTVDSSRNIPTDLQDIVTDKVARELLGEDRDGYITLLHEVQGNNVRTVTKDGGFELRETKFKRFPYHAWKFYPSPFDFFGEGVGELIKYIQDEATLIRNQRRDMQNLNINGMWEVEEGAQVDFYALQNPRPGGIVRVSTHDDIKAMTPPAFQMMDRSRNDEQILNTEADALLNISDFQRGTQTGAALTNTASGIQMILQQSGLKIGESEDDLGNVLSDILQTILFIYKDHMKTDEVIRVVGREGIKWESISKDDINDEIKVTVKMDADLGQNDMKLQRYIQLLSILQGFGNTVDAMPVLEEVLRLHDFPDPKRIFPQYQNILMDPDTENIMLERGYPVEVSSQDNHEEHIAKHNELGKIAEEHILEHQDVWTNDGMIPTPKSPLNAQIGAAQPQQQQSQGMGANTPGQVMAANAGQMGGF
jgi:hypothetical protein